MINGCVPTAKFSARFRRNMNERQNGNKAKTVSFEEEEEDNVSWSVG